MFLPEFISIYFRPESIEKFEELVEMINIYSYLKYFELNQRKDKISVKEKNDHIRFLKKTYLINFYFKKVSKKSKYLFNELLKNLELDKEAAKSD